jgi:hypothetical protein
MSYTHVLHRGGLAVRSPLKTLGDPVGDRRPQDGITVLR